jgi:DNA invertase Pin-like site-specific DNA recombinase
LNSTPAPSNHAESEVRVGLYLRVSSDDQTVENQRRELRAVAERQGWHVAAEFADEGISGAMGRDRRPAFDQLHRAIARRDIDMVAAWSVDRLGRSLQDLVAFLGELHAKNVALYLHQQGLDTSTPAGRAMFGMLSVFSEFERQMIVSRVRAGMARAREKGTKSGRPIGRAPLPQSTVNAIRLALARGEGIRAIARAVRCSPATVLNVRSTVLR